MRRNSVPSSVSAPLAGDAKKAYEAELARQREERRRTYVSAVSPEEWNRREARRAAAGRFVSDLRSGSGGSGDPDHMLGERLNPLLTAAQGSSMPASLLSAVPALWQAGQDVRRLGFDVFDDQGDLSNIALLGMMAARVAGAPRTVRPGVAPRGPIAMTPKTTVGGPVTRVDVRIPKLKSVSKKAMARRQAFEQVHNSQDPTSPALLQAAEDSAMSTASRQYDMLARMEARHKATMDFARAPIPESGSIPPAPKPRKLGVEDVRRALGKSTKAPASAESSAAATAPEEAAVQPLQRFLLARAQTQAASLDTRSASWNPSVADLTAALKDPKYTQEMKQSMAARLAKAKDELFNVTSERLRLSASIGDRASAIKARDTAAALAKEARNVGRSGPGLWDRAKTWAGGHKTLTTFGIGAVAAGAVAGLQYASSASVRSSQDADTAKYRDANKLVSDMWSKATNDVDYASVASDVTALREYVGQVRDAMRYQVAFAGKVAENAPGASREAIDAYKLNSIMEARQTAYDALRPVIGTSTWRAAEAEYVDSMIDSPDVLNYLQPSGRYDDESRRRVVMEKIAPHPVTRVLGGDPFDPGDVSGKEWNVLR